MDILISSNLERLLFDLSGENDAEVRGYMDAAGAAQAGIEVSDNIKAELADAVLGRLLRRGGDGSRPSRRYWQEHGYLIDPHTAVAGAACWSSTAPATGDETPAVVVSTASPLQVLRQRAHRHRGDALRRRHWSCWISFTRSAGVPGAPPSGGPERARRAALTKTVEKQAMEQAVLDFLK